MRERLTEAAADARLPPWPLAATAASSRAAVFLASSFGKALRLLASIAAFSGVLAPSELQQLAFDNVIRRQVRPRLNDYVNTLLDVDCRTASETSDSFLNALKEELLCEPSR